MDRAGEWPQTWNFASGSATSYLHEPHWVAPLFSIFRREREELRQLLVPRVCDVIACKAVFTGVDLLEVNSGRKWTGKQASLSDSGSQQLEVTDPAQYGAAGSDSWSRFECQTFLFISSGGSLGLALYLEAIMGSAEHIHCQSKTHSPDVSLGTVFGKIAPSFSAFRNPTGMTLLYMPSIRLLKQRSYHRKMNPFIQLEQSWK